MKPSKFVFAGGALVVFTFMTFVSCKNFLWPEKITSEALNYVGNIKAPVQAPSVEVVSDSQSYVLPNSTVKLRAVVRRADGDTGTLSYQWYKNTSNNNYSGSQIWGKTEATYTPSTSSEGVVYYYCVVKSSMNGTPTVTSNVVPVGVASNPVTAAQLVSAPQVCISSDRGYIVGKNADVTLTAKISTGAGDSGSLSVQWYSNTTNSNLGGKKILVGTELTFSPLTTYSGTFYYYCVVTSNSEDEPSSASNAIAIKVTAYSDVAIPQVYIEVDAAGNKYTSLPVKKIDVRALSKVDVEDSAAVLEMLDVTFGSKGYDRIILGEDVGDATVETLVYPFRLAKYELSYNLWYEVYQWATDSARGDKIYKFENAGSEGAYSKGSENTQYLLTEGAAPVTKGMPVTGVNWRDAVVWCNAFSEMCGLRPVYYTDSKFTVPLRNATYPEGDDVSGCPLPYGNAKDYDINSLSPGGVDNPYLDTESDGFRLPYAREWEYAARKCADGDIISGKNVPGDSSGYCGSSSDDNLIEQMYGLAFTYSTVEKDYGWCYDNSAGSGPATTAAGWDDTTGWDGSSENGAPSSFNYRMHKQGGKKPTGLGFFDMAGNVQEWTYDSAAPYDYEYDIYPSKATRGYTYQWSGVYMYAGNRYSVPPYVKVGGLRLAQNHQ